MVCWLICGIFNTFTGKLTTWFSMQISPCQKETCLITSVSLHLKVWLNMFCVWGSESSVLILSHHSLCVTVVTVRDKLIYAELCYDTVPPALGLCSSLSCCYWLVFVAIFWLVNCKYNVRVNLCLATHYFVACFGLEIWILCIRVSSAKDICEFHLFSDDWMFSWVRLFCHYVLSCWGFVYNHKQNQHYSQVSLSLFFQHYSFRKSQGSKVIHRAAPSGDFRVSGSKLGDTQVMIRVHYTYCDILYLCLSRYQHNTLQIQMQTEQRQVVRQTIAL